MPKSKIFLISLLMLMLILPFGCKLPTTPDNPDDEPEIKYVAVEAKYQRVDDNPNCPRIYFDPLISDERVYVSGLKTATGNMKKIAEDLFSKLAPRVPVNYPAQGHGPSYRITILDHVFSEGPNSECAKRAHKVWFNGYLMTKIHKEGNGEFLLVRFDENGVPHE